MEDLKDGTIISENFRKLFPEDVYELIIQISRQGFGLTLVGGAVRDYFLNGNLSKDLDFELRHSFEYDEKGNLVRQTTFDKDGNLKAGYSDIAIYEYDFDTNNNEIEIRYIGEDKKPVQMEYTGPAIIKKKYDKKNRIIESRFLNGKGKLIKGFCRIEYDYDGTVYEVIENYEK